MPGHDVVVCGNDNIAVGDGGAGLRQEGVKRRDLGPMDVRIVGTGDVEEAVGVIVYRHCFRHGVR